jgi:hypothetical protein
LGSSKTKHLCEIDSFIVMEMQMWAARFKFASFSHGIYSNYAIHILLGEMMETSRFYIIINSKVGVDFHVPHDVLYNRTSKSVLALLFMIEIL